MSIAATFLALWKCASILKAADFRLKVSLVCGVCGANGKSRNHRVATQAIRQLYSSGWRVKDKSAACPACSKQES